MTHTREWYGRWEFPEVQHGVPTKYGCVCFWPSRLQLGKYTDIGYGTLLQCEAGVIIGEEVELGSYCSVYSVSTIDNTRGTVMIAEKACVGSHCVILPGISIGENSLIGAGTVVTKDVPANVVVRPDARLVYRPRKTLKSHVDVE